MKSALLLIFFNIYGMLKAMEKIPVSTINPEISNLPDLIPRLEGLPKGHAVLFSHQTNHRIASLPSALLIAENSKYREGREDSMHDVWFADATIHDNDGKPLSRLPIALKPYDEDSTVLAGRDYKTSLELSRIGGVDRKIVYSCAGFMRDHDSGILNSITQFEEGVTSCDNLLFNPERSADDIYLALTTAAESLAFLHGEAGMVHGDFLPRNSAYDSSLQFRIIDMTTIRKSTNPDDYIDDVTRYMLGAQDPNIHEELRVPTETLTELFLKKYQSEVGRDLPNSVREEVIGKVGCLLSRLS